MNLLLLLSACLAIGADQRGSCYRFEADSVALSGHVVRRVYPGRPNYESTKTGDEPDTVFVLQLRRPLCIRGDDRGQARKDVREVQLFFSKEDASAIHNLRGQSAILRGTLQEAEWGWHHLPVLLHVRFPTIKSGHRAV